MIKPDAFNVWVKRERIIELFKGLRDFIKNENTVIDEFVSLRDRAIRQIQERSRTESSFQGSLSDELVGDICNTITSFIERCQDMKIEDVVLVGIRMLGYKLIRIATHRLSPENVTAIYNLDHADMELRNKLHDYLDNHFVTFIEVEGDGVYALHWLKTFVRHFLILDRKEPFPLKNLMHVSEEDTTYIESVVLVSSDSVLPKQ